MSKTVKEVLIILITGAIIGIMANFISPKGIAFVRDDSERFAIDTAKNIGSDKFRQKGKLNKAGFTEPVNIPVEAAKQLFDENVKFIDGREIHEFQEGHIKGAVNIPYKDFISKSIEEKNQIMKDLKKDQIMVSYCGSDSCEISIDNAYEMAKIGYTDLKIYLGGYKEWKKLGYPTEN